MEKKKSRVQPDTQNDIFLIYGDEFLVKKQVEKLIDEILPPELKSTNLIVFDGSALDPGLLASHLFTPSLFGGPRVLLVEQVPIFMARSDSRKIINKAIELWKIGDHKNSLRSFGQMIKLSGLRPFDLEQDNSWLNELDGSLNQDQRSILEQIAQLFIKEASWKDAGGDEDFLEGVLDQQFPEGTVLIFTAPGADHRKKIFKTLERRGRIIQCEARLEKYSAGLERSFFEERVRQVLAKFDKKIASSALEKIYNRSGTDLRKLESELEKLAEYVGERRSITDDDVESVFSDFHAASFFDFANVIRTADLSKCLPALHENLRIVSHPLLTLNVMASEFRRLMAARELLFTVFKPFWRKNMTYQSVVPILQKVRQDNPDLIGKDKFGILSMKDYPLYLYLRDSQKFQMERLINIMEKILEADVILKSTRIGARSPRSVLENLVCFICNSK